MPNKSILLVDDEADMLFLLGESFRECGYDVYTAENGAEGLEKYRAYSPGIIITDVMMPVKSGFDMVREIRSGDLKTPIFFLTSKQSVTSAVEGLSTGANDYIRKPFSIQEVLARADAALNYASPRNNGKYSIGKFELDVNTNTLTCGDATRKLPSREIAILALLASKLNETVSSTEILQSIWNNTDFYSSRSLQVHIVRLRKSLAGDPNLQILNTRGEGYRLTDSSK